MNTDPNPVEPLTSTTESLTGWSHLGKTALPLLGRVGTIVGGIFSMLVVFKQISGEIITTIEGFVLVVAALSSGIVVFHQTSIIVNEKKKRVYSYSGKSRTIAVIVMIVASVLLVFFFVRLWTSVNASTVPQATAIAKQTPAPLTRPAGGNKTGSTLAPPTLIPSATPSATSTSTTTPTPTANPTSTPLPLTRTPTATVQVIDQITDVSLLNKFGNEAIAARRYGQAVTFFTRAVYVEATNAQAQFGLGQAYFYQNNLSAATQPFQIALGLDAKLQDAHAYLGWIYDYRQDKAKAIAEYDVFLKAAPRDDPFRPDIADRMKQLTTNAPAPTLTPIGNPPALPTATTIATPTPARPTLTATPLGTPNK